MRSTKYVWAGAAALVGLLAAALSVPVAAQADPEAPPQLDPPSDQQLHNVTYRARIDGVSRHATIAYKIDDDNINTADPSMLPGRVFESTGVVASPQNAGMKVSIDWPYSANLHCEILVDDQILVQADSFIAPRLTRPKDDPNYGTLSCGSALNPPVPVTVPEAPAADGGAAPADAAVPAA